MISCYHVERLGGAPGYVRVRVPGRLQCGMRHLWCTNGSIVLACLRGCCKSQCVFSATTAFFAVQEQVEADVHVSRAVLHWIRQGALCTQQPDCVLLLHAAVVQVEAARACFVALA